MFEKFRPKQTRAIVGVNFDEYTDEFLESVAGFARATQFKITLVHVWESKDYYAPLSTSPYLGFRSALYEVEREDLEKRLGQMAEKLSGVEVTAKVVAGHPPERLQAEAIAEDASLIILGANRGRYNLMPSMFSTALELAAQSPKSVMVIPPGSREHWNDHPWRLLVADDLQDHSWAAIHAAGEFCTHAKGFAFHHFHAHKVAKTTMRQAAGKILEAMTQGRIPFDDTFSEETYLKTIEGDIREKLAKRLGAIKSILEASGSRYHEHIKYGDIKECMDEVICDIDPHMIILGRHEALHRKPFTLGKMPFYTMLYSEIPLLIAV